MLKWSVDKEQASINTVTLLRASYYHINKDVSCVSLQFIAKKASSKTLQPTCIYHNFVLKKSELFLIQKMSNCQPIKNLSVVTNSSCWKNDSKIKNLPYNHTQCKLLQCKYLFLFGQVLHQRRAERVVHFGQSQNVNNTKTA